MQVQINHSGVEPSDAIDQHVQAEVEKAVRKFGERVTRVEVHLHDQNGHHKGGQDKRCVMEARLAGHDPLAVSDDGDDMYLTIKHAAEKMERAIRHKLDRQQAHKSS